MRTAIFNLLMVISLTAFAQKKEIVYKSVYQINGVDLSFSVPDTVTKQLGIQEELKLPLGTIKYFSTYTNGFSQLRIAFVANNGFTGINAPEHIFYTNSTAKTYSSYKADEFVSCVHYQLPPLTPAGDSAVVNGYAAKSYRYAGKDSLNATIWLSKALPVGINPGLAFDGYGGVAKIAYSLNGQQWSLDLVSVDKIEDGMVKDAQNRKPTSTMREPHFLFHRSEE